MSTNDFGNMPNPYESTAPTPLGTPPTVKPASITVFGVLNLVLGIIGLCGIAVSGMQLALVGTQEDIPNPIIEQMYSNKTYFGFMVASVALGFIATIVLVVAGIGLLNGKPYGRSLSIGYAIYGIVSGIIGTIVNAVFVFRPLMEQASAMPDGPGKAGLIGGAFGATIGGVCGMIYPIILLIFMMRAPVVNYMRAQQQPHV